MQIKSTVKNMCMKHFEPDKLISSPVNEDVRIFLVFVFFMIINTTYIMNNMI